MTNKNKGKTLYAIFKNGIHLGNSYGYQEVDAIKMHLKLAKLPLNYDVMEVYFASKAIEELHFFKSPYVKFP